MKIFCDLCFFVTYAGHKYQLAWSQYFDNPVSVMNAKLLLICFLIHFFSNTLACLNSYREINLSGVPDTIAHYDGLPIYYRTFNRTFSQKFIESYQLESIQLGDYKTRSDIAFHLTRLGRYKEALIILRDLYKLFPNEYNIMSNLGTVYELNGIPDSALLILKKTVANFPNGHHGSEWFHLKVLEAKVQMTGKPNWLKENRVLNLGILKPSDKSTEMYRRNIELIFQIKYQLAERIPFTQVPNLLLANVLNELGDILAIEYSISEAFIIYKMGLEYDPSDTYLIKPKVDKVTKTLEEFNHEIPDDLFLYYFPPTDSTPPVSYTERFSYTSPEKQMKRVLKFQDEQTTNKKSNTTLYWLIGIVVLGSTFIYQIRRKV
jgi:tetratricopeptide (TPR) repeat protein